MTHDELSEAVQQDDLYFQATGGGIAFGGGEALLLADFIIEFSKLCRDKWSIAVETSLHIPSDNLKRVMSYVTEYIVDIKDYNSSIYQAYTGSNSQLAWDNLSHLLPYEETVQIRIQHSPAFNTIEYVQRTIETVKQMGFQNIEVLTYYTADQILKFRNGNI